MSSTSGTPWASCDRPAVPDGGRGAASHPDPADDWGPVMAGVVSRHTATAAAGGSSPSVAVTVRQLRVIEARMQTARACDVEAQSELLDHVVDDASAPSRDRADRALEQASVALMTAITLIREGGRPLAGA